MVNLWCSSCHFSKPNLAHLASFLDPTVFSSATLPQFNDDRSPTMSSSIVVLTFGAVLVYWINDGQTKVVGIEWLGRPADNKEKSMTAHWELQRLMKPWITSLLMNHFQLVHRLPSDNWIQGEHVFRSCTMIETRHSGKCQCKCLSQWFYTHLKACFLHYCLSFQPLVSDG